jgi:hypothetical protein
MVLWWHLNVKLDIWDQMSLMPINWNDGLTFSDLPSEMWYLSVDGCLNSINWDIVFQSRDGFMLTLILNKDDYKFNKHKVWYCALMSLECEIWYLRLNDTNVNRLVASTSWVDANLLMILFPFIYQNDFDFVGDLF